ncbi:MAG: chemotaxis-specific protein-glutamate methyltransferase CheB [Tindallia sp. MSAO_Bac2]|nr:MAG: chemotaxis-specific protein-glutamate methyltransferase CheB [Tindallia sp. MSAO_Bac2]
MSKLKALVVDDTIIYRKILTQAVEDTGLCHVEKTAPNGVLALEWLKQKSFDVVLLDVFMPELDGIETLKRIKKDYPSTAVIMISGDGNESVQNTVKALELGAMEFIMKPSGSDQDKNMQSITRTLKILFAQIQIHKYEYVSDKKKTKPEAGKRAKQSIDVSPVKPARIPIRKVENFGTPDLILIASSTGGPIALEKIFTKIQQPINKPVLVVQHMPRHFTKVLAESLKNKSGLNIVEAQDQQEVKSKEIVIAAGGLHMITVSENNKKILRLLDTPMVNGVRPAADVLFKTISEEYKGQRILVVVLTGMGNDGMRGIQQLKKSCNVHCISQSEESCVVYGMPRSVEEAGLSDEVLHLDDIAQQVLKITGSGR